jgi:hypothetical protein
MIILNPASLHSFLDASDYSGPAAAVSSLSNDPGVLS